MEWINSPSPGNYAGINALLGQLQRGTNPATPYSLPRIQWPSDSKVSKAWKGKKKQGNPTATGSKKKNGTYTRRSAITAKSAGFFKAGKKGSKKRYKKRYTASRKGVLATFEIGGTAADDHCIYIGHTTCPPNRMRYMMMHAIIKAILWPMCVYPESVNLTIPECGTGDIFRLHYRVDSESATSPVNLDATVSGTTTPEQLVTFFLTSTTFEQFTNQVEFIRFEFIPDPTAGKLTYKRIVLSNAKLVLTTKSTFKIQNRSINEAGDEDANDVDNVPLYGKHYTGKGSGAQYVKAQTGFRPFIAHNSNGIIARSAGTDETLHEPPNPYHFSNVTKCAKAHLDPGQIKTNTLTYKASVPFYRLLPSMFGDISDPTFKKTSVGKFAMFALERMIHATGEEPELTCAYEHNLELTAMLKNGYPSATARIFEQTFFNANAT